MSRRHWRSAPDLPLGARRSALDIALAPRSRTGQSPLVATLDDLWGSTVRSMGFDPTARVVTVIARVTDAGVTTPFMLRLFGVSELRIDHPDGESWDYTEITEAHATATPTGFVVNLVFWEEPSGLTARCTDYSIET